MMKMNNFSRLVSTLAISVTAVLCGVAATNAYAQKANTKKTATATPSKISSAQANQAITYTNFMQGFYGSGSGSGLRVIHETQIKYHHNINKKPMEEGDYKQDDMVRSKNFDETFNNYITVMSNLKEAPKPADFQKTQVEYLKTQYAEYKSYHDQLLAQHKVLENHFDEGCRLKTTTTKADAAAELAKFDAMVAAIDTVRENILSKLNDMGDEAEAVTLAKHPMKTEIMDMRKTIRTAQELVQLLHKATNATELAALTEAIDAKAQPIDDLQKKYANYTFAKNNPNLALAQSIVKEFFDEVTRFKSIIAEHKEYVKYDHWKGRPINWEALDGSYNGLISNFNNFVSTNNSF